MKNSSEHLSWTNLIQIICLLLILFIAGIQEKQQFSNKLISYKEGLRSSIPVIQERTIPFNLATELIFDELNSAEAIETSNSQGIINELKKRFGKESKIFLIDSSFNPIESQNLNDQEYSDIARFMKAYWLLNERIFPADKAFANRFLSKYFCNSPDRHSLPNFINSAEVRYLGEPGALIIGSLVESKYPKRIKHNICSLHETKNFRKAFRGAIFMFIPDKKIKSQNWVSKNINAKEKSAPIYLGTKEQIVNESSFSDELKSTFLEMSKTKQQGTFTSEKSGIAYCQTELTSNDGQTVFAICVSEIPIYSLSRKLILFAFLLFISGFYMTKAQLLKRSEKIHWKLSISSKFIFLSLISCFLPLSGVLFQTLVRLENAENQRKNEIFNKLELKFSTVEKNHRSTMSDLILRIQTFQDFLDNMEPFDYQKATAKVPYLKGLMLSRIYVSEKNGKTYFLSKDIDEGQNDDDLQKSKLSAYEMVLKYIHKNLKFSQSQSAKKDNFNKSDLYIESATDALGTGSLLQLSVKRDVLLPFKMIHGSVWLYSHFQVDKSGTPIRHFLYVCRSTPFLNDKIDKLQRKEAVSNNYPKMFFMSKQHAVTETMAPTALETNPAMIQMLKFINRAGGSQRREITIGENDYYYIARELKGFNWLGLALMPKSHIEKNLTQSLLPIITALIPVLLIALIALYFNIFYLTPVQEMQKSVEQIASGDYSTKLFAQSNDEIGELCKSFNEMGASLKEKEFLSRFLSDIAKSAISGETQTKATRINATILFSDIRGFTTLSEKNPPEVIVEMLNSYMTSMEEAIEANGGNIEKFIGDAIMAVFLPRLGLENPAIRAAKAALAMTKNLAALNRLRADKKQFQIDSGAGISTGTVLMGTLGNAEGRREYTVTGPAVNAAAQMEKLSKYAKTSKIVVCSFSASALEKSGFKSQALNCAENTIGGRELVI